MSTPRSVVRHSGSLHTCAGTTIDLLSYPLEPGPDESRVLTRRATDALIDFVERLPDAPAAGSGSGMELAESLREAAPGGPDDFEILLDIAMEAASGSFNTTGPGYMAFIPGGGLYTSALGDFIARVVNRFTNLHSPSPAFAEMEATVIRWFADEFAYPPGAGGLLTTGGSMANFSALVTARRSKLPEDFLSGTLYVSDQAHASNEKAARLAGFPQGAVREVPTTAQLKLDVDDLRSMIETDRRAGLQPFCVIASAGTTNTGAIDPLDAIARVCREQDLWFHVDAAYGGFFQMTDRGRERLAGISAADSITLDPHKGMFLPYGTGCLLVRDGRKLRAAHRVGAHYLQDLAAGDEVHNFADAGPELSRDPRGLRLWLPIKLHGLDAFRAALDEKLDLAEAFYDGIRDAPGLEVPWEPELTVVGFCSTAGDEASRELLDRINGSQRVFMSSTNIVGRFVVRACILCHRTHRDRVDEAIGIVRDAARRVADAPQ
jgi:aromatic-L-amino-acid/L-tryptophan decarboxylase